jgi:hypothetical protein
VSLERTKAQLAVVAFVDTPPPTKPSDLGSRTAPTAYTDRDLEQRGWELLTQALETSAEEVLVDFRNRAGWEK